MSLFDELTGKKFEEITWEELKNKINLTVLNFCRWNKEWPNIIILGKREHKVLQNDDACLEFSNDQDYVCGEQTHTTSLRICKVEIDSIIEAGYVV
jgi:hypothetical protein